MDDYKRYFKKPFECVKNIFHLPTSKIALGMFLPGPAFRCAGEAEQRKAVKRYGLLNLIYLQTK